MATQPGRRARMQRLRPILQVTQRESTNDNEERHHSGMHSTLFQMSNIACRRHAMRWKKNTFVRFSLGESSRHRKQKLSCARR